MKSDGSIPADTGFIVHAYEPDKLVPVRVIVVVVLSVSSNWMGLADKVLYVVGFRDVSPIVIFSVLLIPWDSSLSLT